MAHEKMCPVSLEYFAEKKFFDVDVFIQLSQDKYLLLGRAGTAVDLAEVDKYRQKRVDYFFIRAADFSKLAGQAISVAGMIIGQKAATTNAKMVALEGACTSLFGEIKANGFDEIALSHSLMVAQATINLCSTYPQLSEMVERLISQSAKDERHSLLVSAMASMLGVAMGWTRTNTFEKLALGGLLHDLGKLNLPEDVRKKDPKDMNYDEAVIYKTHPDFSRDALVKVKNVPDDVRIMVYEHHEFADGSGFPRGVKDLYLSPYGRVLSLANSFADMVLVDHDRLQRDHVLKVVEHIENAMAHKFNKDCIKALRILVKKEWQQAPK